MRAAVLYETGQPHMVEERPLPRIGPADLLIRVERCGICGSDLHVATGTPQKFPGGMVMGHEFSGLIVEKGADVQDYEIGDHVAAYPATGCGSCAACLQENPILCPEASWVTGGYAEYAIVPARAAIALPAALTPAEGALIEPLTVGLYGMRVAEVQADDRVLIIGGGSIGLTAAYWARRFGARCVVLSRSDSRAAMARNMGADAFVPFSPDEVAAVREALGGAPDIVVECVGAPGMLQRAVDHAGLFGKVISLGLGAVPDAVIPTAAGMKGVSLHFPVGYTRKDFHYVAENIHTGAIDPTMMVTSVISLDDVPEHFTILCGSHADTKVQIAPWKGL